MNVVDFPQLHIEPLTESNLAAASEFLFASWHGYYDAMLPRAIVDERTPAYFTKYLGGKKDLAWLAVLGQRIVAVITVSANCIEELWVDKKYQRRKIGSALVDTAMGHFRRRGYAAVQTGFERFNSSARGFFSSMDWREIGSEYVELEPGKRVLALVYSTNLNASPAGRAIS